MKRKLKVFSPQFNKIRDRKFKVLNIFKSEATVEVRKLKWFTLSPILWTQIQL